MFSEPQNLFLVVLLCFVLNRLDCFQRFDDSTRLAELKIIREVEDFKEEEDLGLSVKI